MNLFDYSKIPPGMRDGILRWVRYGIIPGSFLTAIITNDLWLAVIAADDENIELIPIYVRLFHHKTPLYCHGGIKTVQSWQEAREAEPLEDWEGPW